MWGIIQNPVKGWNNHFDWLLIQYLEMFNLHYIGKTETNLFRILVWQNRN